MLLTGRNLAKSYGSRLLFSGITLGLSEGERIGLIGVNGSGKSTLVRIFAGLETPDEGELIAKRRLRVGYVPQEDAFDPDRECLDCVAEAVGGHHDDHERHLRAGQLLDRAGFADPVARTGTLSGGWRKRLAIVRALAGEPELLLLDEPTNHLDLEGIYWLEQLIANAPFATLTISHDRRFLESIANRIIELGRAYPDGFLSHSGSYSQFVEKRAEFLEAQLGRQQALASGVRREIEWLRRGAKRPKFAQDGSGRRTLSPRGRGWRGRKAAEPGEGSFASFATINPSPGSSLRSEPPSPTTGRGFRARVFVTRSLRFSTGC